MNASTVTQRCDVPGKREPEYRRLWLKRFKRVKLKLQLKRGTPAHAARWMDVKSIKVWKCTYHKHQIRLLPLEQIK